MLIVLVPDQLVSDADEATGIRLRAGGELVDVDEDEVTFRYFDFESSDLVDVFAGDLPPVHPPGSPLRIEGTLTRVDQRYRVSQGICPPAPIPPRAATQCTSCREEFRGRAASRGRPLCGSSDRLDLNPVDGQGMEIRSFEPW